MAYRVAVLPSALRELALAPRQERKRIKEKIHRLGDNPRPPELKGLQGKRQYFRLRSGDYRIIYTVEDDRRRVLIIKVGHRRDVYRSL